MKKEKSLCESCSNRVVIKFHGKNIRKGISDGDCFYEFTVLASNSAYEYPSNGATPHEIHVAHLIVDECSFYNKYFIRPLKASMKESDDSDDSNDSNDRDSSNGVTFKNIPGALLP